MSSIRQRPLGDTLDYTRLSTSVCPFSPPSHPGHTTAGTGQLGSTGHLTPAQGDTCSWHLMADHEARSGSHPEASVDKEGRGGPTHSVGRWLGVTRCRLVCRESKIIRMGPNSRPSPRALRTDFRGRWLLEQSRPFFFCFSIKFIHR